VDFPQIDLESSYLVGDKISDIDCGKAMGLKTVQITSEKYPHHDSADIYASQLWEAIPHLL
jgi:histidinol phosphatase-like enzyme